MRWDNLLGAATIQSKKNGTIIALRKAAVLN